MGSIFFKVWGNLPSRFIGVSGIVVPTWFAARPKDFNKVAGAIMDPENIRFWSLIVLAAFIVYWTIYFYLKRRDDKMGDKGDDDKGGGGGNASHGDGSPVFRDVHGNVTVNSTPKASWPGIKMTGGSISNCDVAVLSEDGTPIELDGTTIHNNRIGLKSTGRMRVKKASFYGGDFHIFSSGKPSDPSK